MIALTWSGDRSGRRSSSSATAPETTAAACDVPLPLKQASPTRASGCARSSAEFGSRRLTIERPGATRSGLRPAPRLDQRGHDVVAHGGGAGEVVGADRQHEGVIAGRGEAAVLLALVARGDDHDDAGLPGLLDRVGEQVALVAARRRAEGEVEDADVQPVVVAVRDDPADRGDDRAERRRAVGAGGLDVDQARARGDALEARGLGSSPAMIPATCVPCPKVSRWARSRSRLWSEKSGPWTTLPWAASAGTGTMPVSITATSTPRRWRPTGRRRSPRARRRASCRASRRSVARAFCRPSRFMRPSPTTAATPAVAPRARSEPAGTWATKPLTTGSDWPTVPPLRSTARCAAASLVGLGAHDHGLHGAVRGPARDQQQRDRGQHGQQRDGEQQATGDDRRRDPNEFPTPRS